MAAPDVFAPARLGPRQFRAVLRLPLILLGGITRKETMDMAMTEGFAFVALARALLREPDLVQRIQSNPQTRSLCIHCNKCMPTIYSGTHCVLVSPGRATALRIGQAWRSHRAKASAAAARHRSAWSDGWTQT